jgi:hypothetical protein
MISFLEEERVKFSQVAGRPFSEVVREPSVKWSE